jgi:hypothetical protein
MKLSTDTIVVRRKEKEKVGGGIWAELEYVEMKSTCEE